ncbi:MAG TPA: SsrA-binding protein SmpB [Bryobacteraceae bacterium]|nr:SsrA-binding protein SmpB [Bryobacteraceae bacterium]
MLAEAGSLCYTVPERARPDRSYKCLTQFGFLPFRTKLNTGIKILSDNRHAAHNYFLLERYEAGVALTGTEVKAARDGKIQLKESYAEVTGNEAWLVNAHISQYSHGNRENHEPTRRRKLLLHRREIDKLLGQTREKGLTLVATKLYLKNGLIKCEIAVGRGKKLHDKRETERKREMEAEARAAIRRHSKE